MRERALAGGLTELLRCWLHSALTTALLVGSFVCCCALAEPPVQDLPQKDPVESQLSQSNDLELAPQVNGTPSDTHPLPCPPNESPDDPNDEASPATPSESFFSKLNWLGLRHSSTSGRNVGMGIPLVSTSWLNRPYYFGADIGTVWVTRPVNDDITTDTDLYGGVFGGCDWDYYWGSELALHRATPELINEKAPDAQRGDTMTELTASLMYYPWGDAVFRPYWRCGIGATSIDYPTDRGHRRDEELWTFPVGLGLKFPIRRWLAARAEIADQLALGNHGVATQHDLTLTFGLEWRFGAHPRSYWPWNPSRHIW